MIDGEKYDLHEARCRRMYTKCFECGEVVEKSEFETHKKSEHVKLGCERCGRQMFKRELEAHAMECSMAEKPCEFCKLPIAQREFMTHYQKCGSRT
jgi:hypothetical protein